eukprot:210648-Chlamydomonas_euryale.AAC.1
MDCSAAAACDVSVDFDDTQRVQNSLVAASSAYPCRVCACEQRTIGSKALVGGVAHMAAHGWQRTQRPTSNG